MHIDLTFLWYYFWRDRHKYHVTKTSQFFAIVLALNRILALIGIFFGNTLRYVYFGCLSSVVRRGISRYLWIFQKGYKLRMNWRLDLIQTNLLPFEGFRNVFYQSFVLQMTFIRAEIRFRAKTIVRSLVRDVYSDRAKSNVIIKFSLWLLHLLHVFTIKINNLFYKRNTGSSHLNPG